MTMSSLERQCTLGLGFIYALRGFGMFLLAPLLSLYAVNLSGATPLTLGIALGIYGLAQAILQIPFGMASDRWGRKPVIIAGLLIFILGSVVAANSHSVYGLIVGRVLQGSGAISAVVLALLSDIVRDTERTKAMAILGVSIGATFTLSLVLGPVLSNWMDIPGLFLLTALLAVLSIVALYTLVPHEPKQHIVSAANVGSMTASVWQPRLIQLYISVFSLHILLALVFVALPFVMRDVLHLPVNKHWHVYLPALLCSFVCMLPFFYLEKKLKSIFKLFILPIVLLAGVQVVWMLQQYQSVFIVIAVLTVFFSAFNFLEAVLPSKISKVAPVVAKGKAMGVYSAAQYVGLFVGGMSGGVLLKSMSISAVFVAGIVVTCSWMIGMALLDRRTLH